jgi:hypothetical protein
VRWPRPRPRRGMSTERDRGGVRGAAASAPRRDRLDARGQPSDGGRDAEPSLASLRAPGGPRPRERHLASRAEQRACHEAATPDAGSRAHHDEVCRSTLMTWGALPQRRRNGCSSCALAKLAADAPAERDESRTCRSVVVGGSFLAEHRRRDATRPSFHLAPRLPTCRAGSRVRRARAAVRRKKPPLRRSGCASRRPRSRGDATAWYVQRAARARRGPAWWEHEECRCRAMSPKALHGEMS